MFSPNLHPTRAISTAQVALLSLALGMATSFAAVPSPDLDIGITTSGTDVADLSVKPRDLKLSNTAMQGKEALELRQADSITVPYKEGDPVFNTKEFTYLLRAKFKFVMEEPGVYVVMGRWFITDEARAAAFIISDQQHMQFLASRDGSAETTAGAHADHILESDQWLTFIYSMEPGKFLNCSVYDAEGDLIEHKRKTDGVVDSITEYKNPLLIGASAQLGMSISRATVWDEALTPAQMNEAAKKFR